MTAEERLAKIESEVNAQKSRLCARSGWRLASAPVALCPQLATGHKTAEKSLRTDEHNAVEIVAHNRQSAIYAHCHPRLNPYGQGCKRGRM
jgi:hypothetical protein